MNKILLLIMSLISLTSLAALAITSVDLDSQTSKDISVCVAKVWVAKSEALSARIDAGTSSTDPNIQADGLQASSEYALLADRRDAYYNTDLVDGERSIGPSFAPECYNQK